MAESKKAKKKVSQKSAHKPAPGRAAKKAVKKASKKVAKKAAKKAAKPVSRPFPPLEPSHDEIALLAYRLWERRGRPFGSSDEDWQRAAEQLRWRAQEAARKRAAKLLNLD